MSAVRVSLSGNWKRFLVGKGAVVYFPFPIGTFTERTGVIFRSILMRGTVLSKKITRSGALSVRVRVHARCRLYPDPVLPDDMVIEVDSGRIIGADLHGTFVPM